MLGAAGGDPMVVDRAVSAALPASNVIETSSQIKQSKASEGAVLESVGVDIAKCEVDLATMSLVVCLVLRVQALASSCSAWSGCQMSAKDAGFKAYLLQ